MTIEEIFKQEKISVRAYNVCIDNDMASLEALKDYYYKYQSFLNLRNCGRKTDEELTAICAEYILSSKDNYGLKIDNPFREIISELTWIQRDVINSFIKVNTSSLPVRSKNAITSYLEGDLKIRNFAEKILLKDPPFNFGSIKNVGKKSIPELDGYLKSIKSFIIKIKGLNSDKQVVVIKNKYLIQKNFPIDHVPPQILESESLFMLIDFLLSKKVFFEKSGSTVFEESFKIFRNQKNLTLSEIGEAINLTRERVRQIRNQCLEELYDKILFVKNFNSDLNQNYGIEIDANQIDVDDDLAEAINTRSRTNFSKYFITYILYVYLSPMFSLIGRVEDVLVSRNFASRRRHNWLNFFLVKKELEREFDFEKFVNDISNRLNDRIDETYFFGIKSYMFRFMKNKESRALNDLLPIGEKILNQEFGMFLDLEGNVAFERNTTKQSYEYAFKALEELGEPSKVKVIYEKIVELYPSYITNELKVRSSMKRSHGFIPIGRKSVYGLKKWEDELDGFKGGTIREIVREYLLQFPVPKQINDISEYVLIYRPKTNEYSIYQNLRLDESGTFVFYEDSLVGLSSKKYPEKFIVLSENEHSGARSWEESFDIFKEFISKENRLPYSSSTSYDEQRLYRWQNLQKLKLHKGELDADKALLFKSVVKEFTDSNDRHVIKALKKYEELISFVNRNHRLPSAHREGESRLYSFFYQQRKMLREGNLSEKEKLMLSEIIIKSR